MVQIAVGLGGVRAFTPAVPDRIGCGCLEREPFGEEFSSSVEINSWDREGLWFVGGGT